MTRRRILMLGGYPGLFPKAEGLPLDIVNLRPIYDGEPEIAKYCSLVEVVDVNDVRAVDAVVDRLHAERPFDRIISHAEPMQRMTGHLTSRLGLPGNSFAAVSLLRDKFALRSRLRDTHQEEVAFALVTELAELRAFVAEHRRVVVKPRCGLGSIGVRMVSDGDDLAAVWADVVAFGLDEVLVEERLTGTEISVEAFTEDGVHRVLAATSKVLDDRHIEVGHAVPAPISPEDFAAAADLTVRVLDTAGLAEGPSHTEIMLTGRGPVLVEAHSRRGGGKINELVALACGLDMERLTWELAAGHRDLVPATPVCHRGAAMANIVPPCGVVREVQGLSEVAERDDVEAVQLAVGPGDRLSGLRWDGDHVGLVVTTGNTADEALRRAVGYAARVRIAVTPLPGEPDPSIDELLAAVHDVLDPFDRPTATGRDTSDLGDRGAA